jgi:endonuclease/exonuclease/phosphatase family metal-dependent hydrolase
MTRGFRDDEFAGDFNDPPDEEEYAEVSKEDWRAYRRQGRPGMTDAECDADWRKHLRGRQR